MQNFQKKLRSFGFQQSVAYPYLIQKWIGTTFVCLLVYVDDVLLSSPSLPLIEEVKAFPHNEFTIKDIGIAKYFLGMEIARTSTSTSLNQRKYVLDILSSTGMIGCKPALTPLPPKLILT